MTTNKPTDKKDRDTEDLKVPAQHEMINEGIQMTFPLMKAVIYM